LNQKCPIIAQRKRKVILHNNTQPLVAKVVKNILINTSIRNFITRCVFTRFTRLSLILMQHSLADQYFKIYEEIKKWLTCC